MSSADLDLMRSLAPPPVSIEESARSSTSDSEDARPYLKVLPEPARELFEWLVDGAVKAKAGTPRETIESRMYQYAAYALFNERKPEPETTAVLRHA